MKVSRRKFMVAAPVVVGAVLGLKGTALGQRVDNDSLQETISRLSFTAFNTYTGTDFTFRDGGEDLPFTLVSVTDTKPLSSKVARGQESFVLKFQGPYQHVLRSNTYSVDHFAIGGFDLFITDGGHGKSKEQYYIAVINRIVPRGFRR